MSLRLIGTVRSILPIALHIVTLLATLVSVTVVCLVIGAFLDPTNSFLSVIGSMVWATFGPYLLVVSLAACLLGVFGRAKGLTRLGGLLLVFSTIGMIGAGFILLRIGLAATASGGAVDVPATFLLGDMKKPVPDVVETIRNVEGLDLLAAIYLPPSSRTPSPVIMYIHGGGFMTGSHTETAADLRWFADKGWLVVSVEYRLFGPGNPTWEKATEDANCGLVWTRRNAARFGAIRRVSHSLVIRRGEILQSTSGSPRLRAGERQTADQTSRCRRRLPFNTLRWIP